MTTTAAKQTRATLVISTGVFIQNDWSIYHSIIAWWIYYVYYKYPKIFVHAKDYKVCQLQTRSTRRYVHWSTSALNSWGIASPQNQSPRYEPGRMPPSSRKIQNKQTNIRLLGIRSCWRSLWSQNQVILSSFSEKLYDGIALLTGGSYA